MNIFSVLIVLITLLQYSCSGARSPNFADDASISDRIKRNDNCVSKVRITPCLKSMYLFSYYLYFFFPKVEMKCGRNVVKNEWTVVNNVTGRVPVTGFKRVLHITPHSVPPGTYSLRVKCTDNTGTILEYECKNITFAPEVPVIIFSRGEKQYVSPGEQFEIDVTKSRYYNMDKPPYTWQHTCNVNKENPECKTYSCNKLPSSGARYTSTMHKCVKTIDVSVSVPFNGNIMRSVSRKHTVIAAAPILDKMKAQIICLKNCDASGTIYTNVNLKTVLQLVCYENCAAFSSKTPVWTIKKISGQGSDSVNFQVFEKTLLQVEPKTFSDNSKYQVTAIIETYTPCQFTLEMTPREKLFCTMLPGVGNALDSYFATKCYLSDYAQSYGAFVQVFHYRPGRRIILAESAADHFILQMASTLGKRIKFPVGGHGAFFDEFTAEFNSTSMAKPQPMDVKRVYLTLYLVEKAIDDDNIFFILQYVPAVLQMIEDTKVKLGDTMMAEFYRRTLTVLSKIRLKSIYLNRQIASFLFYYFQPKNIDVKSKALLSGICHYLGDVLYDATTTSSYPLLMENDVKHFARDLNECSDYLFQTDETEKKITIEELFIPPELRDKPAIKEEYGDYELEVVDPDVRKMKMNAIQTISLASRSVAHTMLNNGTNVFTKSFFESNLRVDYGQVMIGQKMQLDGAVLVPVKGFQNYENDLVYAVATSYKTKLLDTKSTNISTNLVDVTFFYPDGKTQIPIKDVDVTIVFDIQNKDQIESNNYTFAAINNSDALTGHERDMSINVHRLHLTKNRSGYIKIVPEPGDKFIVLVVPFRRPNIDDLEKHGHTVDGALPNTHSFTIPSQFNEKSDIFMYVGIILHPDTYNENGTAKTNFTYEAMFVEQGCIVFDSEGKRRWKDAPCKATSPVINGTEHLKCRCRHTSIFAGIYSSLETKLDTVDHISFQTDLYVNYTIFCHVAIIFLLYAICLIFVQIRQKIYFGRNKVMFAGDNAKNDRFAYLVITKTGGFKNSGTTSNIMLKMIGVNGNSKPHVLNYPDPDKKMLQMNRKDWFIVSNDKYLGELKSIQIWFDAVGVRSSWCCENIIIVDLQNEKEYYFNLYTWFTVTVDNAHIYIIPASTRIESDDTLADKLAKHVTFYMGASHSWNLFSTSDDNEFLYKERVTVMLSQILTTYTFSTLFLYPPTLRNSDAYSYGRFQFSYEMIGKGILVALLTAAINLPIIFLFRHSERIATPKILYKEEKLCPAVITLLTWGVLSAWITFCFLYLITFGFWVTHETSLLWIVVTIFATLINIFAVENAFLICYYVWLRHRIRARKYYFNFPAILMEVEQQRKVLFKKFGEFLLRPYFIRHYHRTKRTELLAARQIQTSREDMRSSFKEFCFYMVYLVLIFALALFDGDNLRNQSNTEMRGMIDWGIYSKRHFNLRYIRTVPEYIDYTLIDSIYPLNWYGRWVENDPGIMADYNTKIMGVARIRQKRYEQVCTLPNIMAPIQTPCYYRNEEELENWATLNGTTTPILGRLDWYDGKGYAMTFGRTLYNTRFISQFMKKRRWIDINTKVLIIEFWTYNINMHFFNAVKILIERDPSGHMVKSSYVFTTGLMFSNWYTECLYILILLTLTVIISIMTLRQIIKAVSEHKNFLRNGWNILDMFLIAFSIILISVYFYKNELIKKVVRRLDEADHNEFIDYSILINLCLFSVYISATLVIVSTVRLWKFLRLTFEFKVMERTVRNAFVQVMATFFCQFVVFLFFATSLHMSYGSIIYSFSTFKLSVASLLILSLDFANLMNFEQLRPYGGKIYAYYIMFMLTTLAFATIYTTILMIQLTEAQKYYSNLKTPYTLKHYLLEEYRYYKEIVRKQYKHLRLKGGKDEFKEDDLVYPKEVPHRYMGVCTMTEEKMECMRLSTLSVMSNFGFLDRVLDLVDYQLMCKVAISFLKLKKQQAATFFFCTRDPNSDEGYKFVEDFRLEQMEYATRKLLKNYMDETEESNEESTHFIPVKGDAERLMAMKEKLEAIEKCVKNIRVIEI